MIVRFNSGHPGPTPRVGYVVKRYPRYSETFIVNEILAHEKAGLDLNIFALRAPVDTHFQNGISEVRAPVRYLPGQSVKGAEFWRTCHLLSGQFDQLWDALSEAEFASAQDAFQALKLAEIIKAKNISHLHAHFATSACTVAQLAARIAGISYSVTMHAKDIFHESVQQADLARKISDAEFVVTVSEYNRRYLVEYFGWSEKIHRIYNGLNLNRFQYHEPKPGNKIVAVGRLVPKKGFNDLVRACRLLLDQGMDFNCEIIGDGELESQLREQIFSLGLDHCITMTGPLPQNSVLERVASANVLVAPCVVGADGNRDGLPTVITEALALGTPCISTDVTGIPEIVQDEQTGLIVHQHNPDQLAAQIQRVLSDHRLQLEFASNGRQLVEAHFDIDRNVGDIRRLIPGCRLSHQPHQTASALKV